MQITLSRISGYQNVKNFSHPSVGCLRSAPEASRKSAVEKGQFIVKRGGIRVQTAGKHKSSKQTAMASLLMG